MNLWRPNMKAYGSKLILFFFSMLIVTSSLAADDANVARNIAFYSNLWDEIINHGKLEMINDQNFVPAVIVHASPENITGIDAMRAYYANYLTGFSVITSYSIHYTKLYEKFHWLGRLIGPSRRKRGKAPCGLAWSGLS